MREQFRREIRKTAESERDIYTADSDSSYIIWLEAKVKDALEYGLDYGYYEGLSDALNEEDTEIDIEEVFNDYKNQL